jgi:hypothetical protein
MASTTWPSFYNNWDGNVDFGYIATRIAKALRRLGSLLLRGHHTTKGLLLLLFFHIRPFSERASTHGSALRLFVYSSCTAKRAFVLLSERWISFVYNFHEIGQRCFSATTLYMNGHEERL